jgi:hypothetical protein
MVSIPFGVINILSRPKNVFVNALPKSFLAKNSGYSLSFASKNFSQNLAHSRPPCPSKTANSPTSGSNTGLVM